MPTRIIDLRMAVNSDMVTFPRIVRLALVMYETWEEFAEKGGGVPRPKIVTSPSTVA